MVFTCLCCCHCKKFCLLLLQTKQICSSKIMFKKPRICYKRFLYLRKLLMLTKEKIPISAPKNFVFVTCGGFQAVSSAKLNLLLTLYLMVLSSYHLQLLKQNYSLKTLFLSNLSICILLCN